MHLPYKKVMPAYLAREYDANGGIVLATGIELIVWPAWWESVPATAKTTISAPFESVAAFWLEKLGIDYYQPLSFDTGNGQLQQLQIAAISSKGSPTLTEPQRACLLNCRHKCVVWAGREMCA